MRNGDRHELIEVGYVVLRRFFDHHPLVAELDRALKDGTSALQPPQLFSVGGDTVSLRYLPMMCERTPQSLDLARTLAPVAEELLGRGALPGRAKGTEYSSDTSWHRDSEHDIQSVGCLAYLDRLTAASGALRVLPRSHQDRTRILPDDAGDAGLVIETDPGDVIVFDEHLVTAPVVGANGANGGWTSSSIRARSRSRPCGNGSPRACGTNEAMSATTPGAIPVMGLICGRSIQDGLHASLHSAFWLNEHPGTAGLLIRRVTPMAYHRLAATNEGGRRQTDCAEGQEATMPSPSAADHYPDEHEARLASVL